MNSSHLHITTAEKPDNIRTEISINLSRIVLDDNLNASVGLANSQATIEVEIKEKLPSQIEYTNPKNKELENLELDLLEHFQIEKFKELYDITATDKQKNLVEKFKEQLLTELLASSNSITFNKFIFFMACKHLQPADLEKFVNAVNQTHPSLFQYEDKIYILDDYCVHDENKKIVRQSLLTNFEKQYLDIYNNIVKLIATENKTQKNIAHLISVCNINLANTNYAQAIQTNIDSLKAIIENEQNPKQPKSIALRTAELLMMATIVLYAVYALINYCMRPKKSELVMNCEKQISSLSLFAKQYPHEIEFPMQQVLN